MCVITKNNSSKESEDKDFLYGGQAVIEGVMMRGKTNMAVAIRNSNNEIILHIEESNVTKKVFDEIITFINTYKIKMKRLGIVGAHGFLSLKLRKQLKNINDLDYYFCNDYQKAKDIIIGLIKKS